MQRGGEGIYAAAEAREVRRKSCKCNNITFIFFNFKIGTRLVSDPQSSNKNKVMLGVNGVNGRKTPSPGTSDASLSESIESDTGSESIELGSTSVSPRLSNSDG